MLSKVAAFVSGFSLGSRPHHYWMSETMVDQHPQAITRLQAMDSWRDSWRRSILYLQAGLMLLLVGLSGCGGCFSRTEEKLSREEQEKRRREQRDAIELYELVSLPLDSDRKQVTVKPGHWHETQQRFKSNREDLQVVVSQSMSRGGNPVAVPGTDMINDYTRRTSLPKGQTKTVEIHGFVPGSGVAVDPDGFDSSSGPTKRLEYRTSLLSWPLMTPILTSPLPTTANELKSHEYQMFVVGPQALSYEYLTVLDAVLWRKDERIMSDQQIRSYYVSLIKPENNRYEIPRSFLTMTSVAVVLWDDVAPDDLTLDQQHALLDWLHWGGQLIVSGPNSWSRLQSSFLSPYLPAVAAATRELTSDDFAELSSHWVVDDMSSQNASRDPLEIVGAAVPGLQLQLGNGGQWLPRTGQLVAESQIGRGRIVLTSFPLREPRIFRWKYFGSFFSTGLLRRAPRTVSQSLDERALFQRWGGAFANQSRDPRLHSNVRVLSRDLPLSSKPAFAPVGDQMADLWPRGSSEFEGDEFAEERRPPSAVVAGLQDVPWNVSEATQWSVSAASWDDASGLCSSALFALKAAAGIELPTRSTIIYLIGGYLLCLVPLNWLFFRSIGRLEYAWIAAPIMALIGVVVVTRVASLDIGFARRTTEISVLELHGGYPRAHVTKFLALYTSLSTNYSIDFPESNSVALPMSDPGRMRSRAVSDFRRLQTAYGRTEGTLLEPFVVYSNSTDILHAEQIIPLDGGLAIGETGEQGARQPAIRNQTGLNLRSAVVMRCLADNSLEQAWLGEIASGEVVRAVFEPCTLSQVGSQWNDAMSTQSEAPTAAELQSTADALWIGGILHDIVLKTPLVPGQTRLIGYTDDRPGMLNVKPKVDQFEGRCIVVAHLTPVELGDVQPDARILGRFKLESEVVAEDEGIPE
jgi:hypothetical protein